MSSTLRWLAERVEDGELWFRIGRDGDDFVAEWPGLCALRCRSDGTGATLTPEADAPEINLEKVRTGAAYALVESLRGKVALHAGAVARGDSAVVLVGRNHAGKSSAVADLCMHGGAMLADDIAVIDGTGALRRVEVTERHHWLGAASREALGLGAPHGTEAEKHPVAAREVRTAAVSLRAIVALEFAEGDAHLIRLEGIDAMGRLVPSVVRFALDDPGRSRQELRRLVDLVEGVPFFLLRRPRDLLRIREGGVLLEGLFA